MAIDEDSPDSQRSLWDDPRLSPKVREACRVAREAGYDYLWIDSCCIDKASSSELSEAINSMYLWYSRAKVCYAYLADVPSVEDLDADKSAFRSSRWFKRGWTLQELIAPLSVTFLAMDWKEIGAKHSLACLVEDITSIPQEALLHMRSLDEFSVAQRLSWAARRETTREEDRAYSLLGIFDINMPTLYGEGTRAFRRLQEEIVRRIPDLSLFAWRRNIYGVCRRDQDLAQALENAHSFTVLRFSRSTPFDSSIESFGDGGMIEVISHSNLFRRLEFKDLPAPEYTFTPHGIRTQFPVIPLFLCLPDRAIRYDLGTNKSEWYLVILGCEHEDHPGALLGQVCYIPRSESGVEYLYYGHVQIDPDPEQGTRWPDLFPLSSATIERCRTHIQVKPVYISEPERATVQPDRIRHLPHKWINLVLLRTTRAALRAQGYTAELRGPDKDHPTTHWLTLSNHDHIITIEYHHMLVEGGRWLTIEAHVTMSRPPLGSAEEIGEVPDSAHWFEGLPWAASLRTEEAAFSLVDKRLTVQLSFDWAPPSNYLLRIQVVTEPLRAQAPPLPEPDHTEEIQLVDTAVNEESDDAKDDGDTERVGSTGGLLSG